MNRRHFLSSAAIGSAALAAASMLPGCATALDKKKCVPRLELKLSFQEGIAPGKNLGEQLDFMEDLEVRGFEPSGRNLPARVNEIRNALSGRDIEVSAICAGFDGFILAEDPAVKASFDKSMREIVAAAGELGSVGVIMVPAFNGQTPCRPHTLDTRNYLCEQLHDLGEFALEHGTTVILEPLNRREAFYLRQVADAAAIARDSNSKGVKVMGDFWHMSEETSDYGALTSAGIEYLQHVHIASRGRRLMPGEDGAKDDYKSGFRALQHMDYKNYVSFECGTAGDRAKTVREAVKLLSDQWYSL